MGDVPILERRKKFRDSDFDAQSTDNHILEKWTCITGTVSNNDRVGQEVIIHMLLTKDILA
jgi:hypothetical protein